MTAPDDPPPAPPPKRSSVALPTDVQDHLGRRLRSTLMTDTEKPAYLGDESLPPQFEGYIRRLEGRDRPSQTGLDAVRNALGLNEAENREPRRPKPDGSGSD